MCGIAGWIGPEAGPDADQLLRRMTGTIAHRGPDGDGHAFFRNQGLEVALGHRRLSIIDLAGGAQPMTCTDGRFTVVFNGEIYNYLELQDSLAQEGVAFRTRSDTEAILEGWKRWGRRCLSRFRGMFAFALWDAAENELILARDPFGKKPLFLVSQATTLGDRLIFASEIEALLAHPLVEAPLDQAAVYEYLTFGYVPGPGTFFKTIGKLPPGSALSWRQGRVERFRYWIAPEEREAEVDAPEQPVEAFRELFDAAVKLRLRSDVPVGAFLSSGLDSTAVVATAMQLGSNRIRTFSVGFKDDPGSELGPAAETAHALGCDHTPVELDPADLIPELPEATRRRGAPVSDPADLPIYMMSKVASERVKVILSGEGSDEVFAGYPKYVAEAVRGWPGAAAPLRFAAGAVDMFAGLGRTPGRRLAIAARALRVPDFEDRMIRWFAPLDDMELARLWRGVVPEIERSPIPFNAAPNATALRRALHFDQTSWLPDNLLERLDRMTMASSIEARNPFMDSALAEFAATLPDHWRIQGLMTKRVIRAALSSRIPEAVLKRPKIGFRIPVGDWFRCKLKDLAHDMLLSKDAHSAAWLDRGEVRRLLCEHVSGARRHDKKLWMLFALETFLDQYAA